MARYTYPFRELWRESTAIVDREIAELADWLHRTEIDPDFDPEQHVYAHSTGDRWIFLPELTQAQLFAATLILCSSELHLDNKPVRFERAPEDFSREDL